MDKKQKQDLIFKHCFKQLIDYIAEHRDYDRVYIAGNLLDFQDMHGDTALIDMWGWVMYCRENEKHYDDSRIMASIGHDLNGRNDKFMLPRTDGYATHVWGKDYATFKFHNV